MPTYEVFIRKRVVSGMEADSAQAAIEEAKDVARAVATLSDQPSLTGDPTFEWYAVEMDGEWHTAEPGPETD